MTEIRIQAATAVPGYEILTELGRGGVSTVYLARHELLQREVAIKVMSPALAVEEGFNKRFIREGQTIARLEYPGIVKVYDVSVADYRPYIAMEYLAGGSLKDRMKTTIPPLEAISLLRSIADSLGYAHDRGVCHRDVKPENILFRESGDPVLTDFGIAKSESQDTALTSMGVVVGTPRYISPEQAQGHGCDARSDIYALGVMLHEMLTGRPPYNAKGSMSLLYAHINDPIPRLPTELEAYQELLDDLLAKDPAQRIPDCTVLGQRLVALLEGSTPAEKAGQAPVVSARGGRPPWYARPESRVWLLTALAATLLIYLVRSQDLLAPGVDSGAGRDFSNMVTRLHSPSSKMSPGDANATIDKQKPADKPDLDLVFSQARALHTGVYGKRDLPTAVDLYRVAAAGGHALSQFHLGVAYGNGQGVDRDERRAVQWLARAASAGIQDAKYNLILANIFGPAPDAREAARVAQELAEQEYTPAYRILGWMYNTGTGVNPSITQSVRWGMKTMVGDMTGKSHGPRRVVERWERQMNTTLSQDSDSQPLAGK